MQGGAGHPAHGGAAPASAYPSQPPPGGFKGLTQDKADGRYRVRINLAARRIYLVRAPAAGQPRAATPKAGGGGAAVAAGHCAAA